MKSKSAFLLFARLVGAVLIAAAMLKSFGMTDSVQADVVFGVKFSVLLICLELALGAWLMIYPDRLSLIASLAVFLIFSITNAYQWYAGVARCGCFGKSILTPLHGLLIDMACIIGLLISVRHGYFRRSPNWLIGALRFTGVSFAIAVCGMLTLIICYGDFETATARLHGQPFVLNVSDVNFSLLKSGDHINRDVTIKNISNDHFSIVGLWSGCGCIIAEPLPLIIEPGASRTLSIGLSLALSPELESGQFNTSMHILTSSNEYPEIRITASAVVSR
jgi:hypothetical protein